MEVVGRDVEWRAVDDWLARRDPPVLLLHGETGIGKTTLWAAGVAAARESGCRVLSHTAAWSEPLWTGTLPAPNPYGDGKAGERIAAILLDGQSLSPTNG